VDVALRAEGSDDTVAEERQYPATVGAKCRPPPGRRLRGADEGVGVPTAADPRGSSPWGYDG
jgi:hypothetical protein